MRPVSSRSSRRTSRCAACVHRIAHGAAATYGNPSSRRRSSCDTTRPAAESARATPRASASSGVTGSSSIGASASAASTGSTRRGGALRRRPPFGAGFRSVSGAVRGLMVHSMHHQPSRSKGSVSAPTPEGPTPQEALHTGRAFRGAKRSAFLPLWTCRALAAWAIFLAIYPLQGFPHRGQLLLMMPFTQLLHQRSPQAELSQTYPEYTAPPHLAHDALGIKSPSVTHRVCPELPSDD